MILPQKKLFVWIQGIRDSHKIDRPARECPFKIIRFNQFTVVDKKRNKYLDAPKQPSYLRVGQGSRPNLKSFPIVTILKHLLTRRYEVFRLFVLIYRLCESITRIKGLYV